MLYTAARLAVFVACLVTNAHTAPVFAMQPEQEETGIIQATELLATRHGMGKERRIIQAQLERVEEKPKAEHKEAEEKLLKHVTRKLKQYDQPAQPNEKSGPLRREQLKRTDNAAVKKAEKAEAWHAWRHAKDLAKQLHGEAGMKEWMSEHPTVAKPTGIIQATELLATRHGMGKERRIIQAQLERVEEKPKAEHKEAEEKLLKHVTRKLKQYDQPAQPNEKSGPLRREQLKRTDNAAVKKSEKEEVWHAWRHAKDLAKQLHGEAGMKEWMSEHPTVAKPTKA